MRFFNIFNRVNDREDLKLTEEMKTKRIDLLTQREHELFLLMIEGFTLKEAAKRLSIKYFPAGMLLRTIYKKLRVNSNAELIINYWKLQD